MTISEIDADRSCGARHPTNSSVIPCMLFPHPASVTHWSTSGCAGGEFSWQSQDQADLINHPPHYTAHPSGVECITITEHMGFNVGNAVKYLWRADEEGCPDRGSGEGPLVRRPGGPTPQGRRSMTQPMLFEPEAPTEQELTCLLCGKTEPNTFLLSLNHGLPRLAGHTECTAMRLTRNHVTFAASPDRDRRCCEPGSRRPDCVVARLTKTLTRAREVWPTHRHDWIDATPVPTCGSWNGIPR